VWFIGRPGPGINAAEVTDAEWAPRARLAGEGGGTFEA
jgi:hypothetical protein